MGTWLKENALAVIITLSAAGVAVFWIHNSYRLAEVKADVEKVKAYEGKKYKFGTTSDKTQ